MVDHFILPDSCFDNVSIRTALDLPECEFKIGKVKYKATDLRLLNPLAIRALDMILGYIKDDPNTKEVTINVINLDKYDIFVVDEIIQGLSYVAKKGGKNGYTIDSKLFPCTVWHTESEEEHLLTFEFGDGISDEIKALHNYLNSVEPPYQYAEIVKICAEVALERFKRWCKEGADT